MVLANPSALQRLGSRQHTDRVDAARLAKMLAMNAVPPVWVPRQEFREVRRLLQYRSKLVQQEVRCKSQAKAVLRRLGCDNGWVRNADSILQAADQLDVGAAEMAILLSTARSLASVEKERQIVETEIACRLDKHPEAQVLLSIPGVGMLTAAAIWAWIGKPGRFRSSKQVASYAGLDPSVHQSGETYYHGRISKNGNVLLRFFLIEAAQVIARHDRGRVGQFYRRKRLQIGARKAVVAPARKLVVVAWKMLLTGESYRDEVGVMTQRKLSTLRRLSWGELSREEVAPTSPRSLSSLEDGSG